MKKRKTSLLYRLKAKYTNRKARKMRLANDGWEGIPLPTGKEGYLRISRETLAQYPKSFHELEKIMSDRARDLGVHFVIQENPKSQSVDIWWSRKNKRLSRLTYN